MRGTLRTSVSWPPLVILTATSLVIGSGCRGSHHRSVAKPSVTTSSEPALSAEVEPGATVIDPGGSASTAPSPSTQTVSVVDRHPLLRKPKQYYDSTQSNKAVKTAAAAVVGVPAGIVGEIKQIVVGTPSGESPTIVTPTVTLQPIPD